MVQNSNLLHGTFKFFGMLRVVYVSLGFTSEPSSDQATLATIMEISVYMGTRLGTVA